MKYGKRILCFCITLLLLTALLAVCACADSSRVEEAQNSVVRVYVTKQSEVWSIGSGFAVGEADEKPDIIVTNYHVVEDSPNSVYVTTIDANNGIKAEVIYKDTVHDVAILRLSQKLSDRAPIALFSSKEIHKSQDIYCIGFPFSSDAYSNNQTFDSRIENMTVTKGTVSNNAYISDGVEYVLSDVKVNSGNSGGPMVDEYGQAIGINTAILGATEDYGNNMTVAVSIDYVMDILDDLEITYIKGSADGKVQGKDAGEGLLSGDSGTIVIIIVSALAAVAVIVVGIILLKKKKNKNTGKGGTNESAGGDTNVVTAAQKGLVVTCERGPLKGRSISGCKSVRVGRNSATCNLAFPDDTPGVSKEHCEIYSTPSGIVVSDLGSTYGTYLSDGSRVQRGEHRNVGNENIILIGSDKVILSVKMIY